MNSESGMNSDSEKQSGMKSEDERTVLGKGVSSTVYESTKKGRRVAVKEYTDSSRFILPYELEYMCLFNGHPNFVQVIDSDQRSITMERFDLTLLKLMCILDKPIATEYPSFAYSMWVQMATVLSELYSQDVLHLDLKPENIGLRVSPADPNDLLCVVFDFGLSRYHDSLYDSDTNIQTLEYRAFPDLLRRTISFPSDMWSLGCIMYEVFTHTVLFVDVDKHIDQPMAYITSVLDQLHIKPSWALPLVKRMLDTNPDTRITPFQLLDELYKIV